MARQTPHRKCKQCQTYFVPDPRCVKRQHYCSQPECRKASKVASQQRWLNKPANRDYFKDSTHVERVRAWRQAHPGYWRPYGQNIRTRLPIGGYASPNAGTSACLSLPSHPYSASRGTT